MTMSTTEVGIAPRRTALSIGSPIRHSIRALVPTPVKEPEVELGDTGTSDNGYRVILYNDDWHTFDEVVAQVQKAVGCDIYRAMSITLEAHQNGRAICYRGERSKCHQVAGILRQIRLQVEVDCD